MLYNNSKDVLNAIKAVVAEDRQKYVEEKTSLEGRLQIEEMKKMKMEYVVPEEIEKEGVAHFMGAAAAAHKAGKKQFAFGGKTYPVKIKSHIAKQVNETLKGNQHKIDANKNGKIDAQDFKMLRKEETEQIDEISKKTLGSYVKKASVDMANRTSDATKKKTLAGADYAHNISRGMDAKTADKQMKSDYDDAKPDVKKAVKRMYGIDKAVARLTKEEVEELDELSKGTLASYAKKASADARFKQSLGKDYEALGNRKRDPVTKGALNRAGVKLRMKSKDRLAGVEKAVDRLAKEEVEMDEATITQGANKGKQWTPSTNGPTNKIKPSSKDLPAPMDGATAPPPKAMAKGMKKEGMFDTIGSKIKSAFSGGSPVGSDVKYGATSYGSGSKSGWSGDATGSSQYSRGVTSTSASSSLPSGSFADFLKNPGIKPKTEASSLVNKVAKKIKQAVAPEVKPMKMKEEVELAEAEQKDTPGQHVCAVHVKHQTFGEGKTITTQHAEPAADGSIAWYDVMFEHGIEKQVATSDLEIILAETHTHCKDKK